MQVPPEEKVPLGQAQTDPVIAKGAEQLHSLALVVGLIVELKPLLQVPQTSFEEQLSQ